MAGFYQSLFLPCLFQIVIHHHLNQFVETDLRLPTEKRASFARIAPQVVYFAGAQVARIQLDVRTRASDVAELVVRRMTPKLVPRPTPR